MSPTVATLLAGLVPDCWRETTPFSIDIAEANQRIFEACDDSRAISGVLRQWLQKHQPCLFGRIAARQDRITYCVLTEGDLLQTDEAIQSRIQEARLEWTREGFKGKKSGFVILVASPKIALAAPDQNLQALAQRLCSLYLLQEIGVDRIYHDEIFLEETGHERSTWMWLAGVNYFCTNADGRWWRDHRIPGGLAFSVNSVGHFARAGAAALEARDASDGCPLFPAKQTLVSRIDSLSTALEFAMRTIRMASDGLSGKATELSPLPDHEIHSRRCPIELPPNLVGKDCRHYMSYYHTDFTLPSEYFLPDIHRPHHCNARSMDLTYLHNTDFNNPDHITMGTGRRIRTSPKETWMFIPRFQQIDVSERLVRALNHN